MPDIDPSSLHHHHDPLQTSLNPSSLSIPKQNAMPTAAPAPKASKAAAASCPPRVDIEPIYTNLKAAIGEHWADYKHAVGRFIIGKFNQNELDLSINHLLNVSPEAEHLHNSLITAIYANAYREPPEPGVAPWVAANDKPSASIGGSGVAKGGDKVEERLRREVTGLPARDRRRLKEIGEPDTHDPYLSSLSSYRHARAIKLPDHVPASAGGLNKTNWDIEIRKRYTHALFHETLEFPDPPSIATRMLPICYEEALPNGPADQCPEFMATATEMFIKDVVGSVLALTRGATSTFGDGIGRKRKRGEVPPLDTPQQRPLGMSDLRFALGISNCSVGPMPDITAGIAGGWPEGVLEGWETWEPDESYIDDAPLDLGMPNGLGISVEPTARTTPKKGGESTVNGVLTNGALLTNGAHAITTTTTAMALTNGSNGVMGHERSKRWEEPAVDGWAGSSSRDSDSLFGLLDECLATGQ